MSATDPMVDEFFIEALSLLDEAEDGLICYEKGEATEESYNCIYRAFHSVKGGAGMFEVTDLQGHLHHLENLFGKVKELGEIPTDLIDYFLKGVDAARDRMKTGELNFSNKTFAELMGQEDDSTTAQKSPDAPVKGRPTLVLVDDEVEILDGLSTILRDESYNVVTFNQASTFIEKLSSMEIDLLLTDFKMPGINGLELVQIVHKAKPQLPIVMISGFLDPNIIIEGLSVGISGFIQKPIKFNYLLPMISNFIKKYRSYTLLEESVKALLFQYTDLDNYLKDNGEDDIRNSLKQKIVKIIEHQKNLAL